MSKIFLYLSVILVVQSVFGQTVHTVEVNSKNNRIEFYLTDFPSKSNLMIEIKNSPKIFIFEMKKKVIENAYHDLVSFDFSVTMLEEVEVGNIHKVLFEFAYDNVSWSKEILFKVVSPFQFQVFQNYPNPFNPTTRIKYQVPSSNRVNIKVFDVLGKEIVLLKNEIVEFGNHEVEWNAGNLPSGFYIYRLEYGNQVVVKKMLLMK